MTIGKDPGQTGDRGMTTWNGFLLLRLLGLSIITLRAEASLNQWPKFQGPALIERLWEALMFACMELKGDPADALVHAMDIYNHKAPEMLRMRKARMAKGFDPGNNTIGNVIARRIMAKYGIPEPGPKDLARKRRGE